MSSIKNHDNFALKLAQFKSLDVNEEYIDNFVDVIFQELHVNEKVPSTNYLKNHRSELIGVTLLHLAYKEKNLTAFDMLINKGADFCMKDSKGFTVLHSTFQYDSSALNSFEWNILKSYFCTESFFVVSILSAHVKYENSNNPSDSNGLTHFHVACATNNIEAVEFFLKSGVPVNQVVFKAISGKYFKGYTGLHFAAQYSHSKVIDLLLEHGANANLEDAKKRTPLYIALEKNIAIIDSVHKKYRSEEISRNQKIIKLLIDHDVFASSLYLYIASCMESTTEIKNYLTQEVDVNQSVSMNSRNWPGYTALHFAAHVNFNTVILLMKHGGDIEAKNANGITPFDMCIGRYKPEDIIDILRLVPKWRNIVLSDGETNLTDLLMAFKNIKKTQSFLEESDDNVELFVPQNSALWSGFTVLHLAVMFTENSMDHIESQLAMIKECLEHGANVTVKDHRNWTPIHLAFRLNKLKIVDLMLEYHHRMQNYVDDENLSHLHVACALRNSKFVEKLLWNYADVNVVYEGKSSISSVTPGSTPLHIAVRNNDVKTVKLLLQFNADPHVLDACNFTPIHHLTYHLRFHSRDIANTLLSMVKLSDHVVEDVGLSYLHIAAGALNVDAVRTLLDLGTNVNRVVKVNGTKDSHLETHNGYTALHFALERPNSSEIVKLLLERGANILANDCLAKILSSKDYKIHDVLVTTLTRDVNNLQTRVEEETGMTLLHVACCSAHVELIKKVLDIGDDVNGKIHDKSTFRPGCTPLHLLVYDEYSESRTVKEAIELLIRRGADVNVKNKEGFTPLHVAYGKLLKDRDHFISNLTQVDLLLQAHKNFRINPTDVGGISHFHIACHMLDVEVIEKFLKHNVNVNATIDLFHDSEIAGCSPLLLTLKDLDGRKKCTSESSAKFRIVELLIKRGARVNVEDIDGNTPAHYAPNCVMNKDDPRLKMGVKEKNFLQILASAGADTNAKNVRRKTPLELLIKKGSLKLDDARYFIKCGCTFNAFDQITEEGYIARINALLSHGDMEYLLEETFTNYLDSVKRDNRNRTAIHNVVSIECCETGEKELAELIDTMIGFDCDIDEQDDLGKTALHIAVQFRNEKAVKGLLLAGADINIFDHDGKTPFAYLFERCTHAHTNSSAKNHNQYDHRELFDIFVYHVKKMEHCGLYVEESNANLLNEALVKFDIDEDEYDMDDFYDEFDQMVDMKIEPYSITLMDFVYDADVVFDYPRMYEKKCDAIDKFFENNLSGFRDEFRNAAGIFQLQYRQAVQRRKIFGAAENALTVLMRLRLPNVCSDIIFDFLENFELRNLIASME